MKTIKRNQEKRRNNERLFEKIKNQAQGITLIALVVTIIVLLILAGVAINLTVGDNGLFKRAQNAADTWLMAEQNEQSEMDKAADIIDNYIYQSNVEQVVDSMPGVLETEQTDPNTYIINSIEDLVFFAYDVREGNYYEGKNVKLGLSLDFDSNKSYVNAHRTDYEKFGYSGELKATLNKNGFIPIGIMEFINGSEEIDEKSFKGVFDGDGNKIYNLKIRLEQKTNENQISMGMFSANNGIIQNLGIENGIVTSNINLDKFSGISILVGNNRKNGIIRNCYTTGEINCFSSIGYNIGGIAGANDGKVYSCYNKANITIYKTTSNLSESLKECRVGGIIGSTADTSVIENVYNEGNVMFLSSVTYEMNVNTYLAGLVGLNFGLITNAYSVGKIISQEDQFDDVYIGNISGRKASGNVINCYYLPETILTSNTDNIQLRTEGQETSEDKMKEESFVDLLNNEANIWKRDIENINGGYPIFIWQ